MKAIKTTLLAALLLIGIEGFGQSAGPDQNICQDNSFGYATATMAATGTGTWSGTLPTNPSSTVINNTASPTTYITGFTVPGVYGFVWSAPAPDTVYVTVLPSPTRPVLTLVGQCLGSDTLRLTGGYGDSITWVQGSTNVFTTGRDSILIPTLAGSYLAFVYGSNGCNSNQSDTVWVTTCIDSAGPDQTICSSTATMAAVGTGSWSASVSNPGPTTITNPASPTTTITGFIAAGYYVYVWTTSAGHLDTVQIAYRAIPQSPLLNAWNGTCLGDSFDVATTGDALYWLLNGGPTSAPPVVGTFPGGVYYQPTQAGSYTAYRQSVCGVQSGISDTLTFVDCGPGTAGPDQTICQGNSFGYATAIMAATGTGTWSGTLSTNPSSTVINDAASSTTYITGFTVPGVYGFVWSAPAPDTVYVTVLPSPARPVLTLTGQCLGSDTLTLTGVNGDSITWAQNSANIFTTGRDSVLIPTLPGSYLAYISGSNGCHSDLSDTVWVTLCPTDTVWPGDADNNRVVDNADLLPIGLGYDSVGPVRSVTGIVWQADNANNWPQYFSVYAPTVNFNHADGNGDGIINAADTAAIMANFGLTHAKTRNYPGPWRAGVPGFYLSISQDTLADAGVFNTSISLGDTSLAVPAIYGLAFTFNYDPLVVDTSSASFSFVPSWLGSVSNSIHISRNLSATGEVQAAITGINHLPRNGNGQIATFAGTITTGNINGKNLSYYHNVVYISDITAIDQHGNLIPLNAGIDSNYVAYTPNGISNISQTAKVNIYPNPATTTIRVASGTAMSAISITDVLGKEVSTVSVNNKLDESIDISALEQGVYIIRVLTVSGTATTKLVVSR